MNKKIGQYELHEQLGQGSYGKVYVAKDSSSKPFAIKILDKAKIKQENLIENLRQEIQIMKHINHPNVVKLHEVLSSHSKIYLVLELVTGGELFTKLKEKGFLSESEALYYFQQIISAVAFCETQQIAHRDLKLENILLDSEGHIKISDFGLSGLVKYDPISISLMHTTCGTVNYLAPEVFGNQGYDGHVADIWSCGVILYALFTGCLPFQDDSISKLIQKIISGKIERISSISLAANDLLEKILVTDPRMRISIANIKKHPWFETNYVEYTPERIRKNQEEPETELGEDKPREMDAFELLNFSAGIVINRMFDCQETGFCSHIFSRERPDVIAQRAKAAIENSGYKEKERENRFLVVYESKAPPLGSLTIEVLRLMPDLFIMTFMRSSGGLVRFKRIVDEVVKELADITIQGEC